MERITIVLQRLGRRGPSHKRGFVELFVSKRLIQGLAVAMLTLFTPIFLFETSGQSFVSVGIFYLVVSVAYSLLLVPAMQVTNHFGFSRALALSAVFATLQFAILYFMDPFNYWQLVIPLAVALIGFRLFHWVPYHVDFAQFTSGTRRGRDVSLMLATIAFMGVIGPILAGYIISQSGYPTLFLVAIGLMVLAAVSYLFVPATAEKFTWSYGETCRNLFSPNFRPLLYSEFAGGIEVVINLVVWPIFLFIIFNGNVLEVGALSTVIVGATIIIQLLVGRYIDKAKKNSRRTLQTGSMFYAIGWVLKIFVLSLTHVFLVGLYHSIAKIFTSTPYNAMFYDMSGDQGRYIDEFTVMKEMTHHAGRAVGLLAMLGLTAYFSIEWTFAIAAIASLFLNTIYLGVHEK